MQLTKWDGHVHSPYCPHGTKDSLRSYIETALDRGLERISFTEHAPLPEGLDDPAPEKDSGMTFEDAERYIEELTALREEYKDQIDIRIGLEFDYFENDVDGTRDIIARYAPRLTDGILSLHYLWIGDRYYSVDYSDDTFAEIVEVMGSVKKAHERYYEGIQALLMTNLGEHQPKRLGHLTLPTKYIKRFPLEAEPDNLIETIKKVRQVDFSLDVNTAGFRKPLCGLPYPYPELLTVTQSLGIPLVYGSDAHLAQDVAADFDFNW
ncbi:histidinol-phosphatase HisJ [Exiguobacterium flavidum]|uniref:histidinol-phosphatase HisJ n=1 Tax=Exiguobacterium flavidum TaxID=2184695 RepID=UPI000DF8437B|nr:histidinol-phosphatase HisJ [Exiguobacterium flavidum]